MQVEEEMTALSKMQMRMVMKKLRQPKSPLEVTEETKEVVEERPASCLTNEGVPSLELDGMVSFPHFLIRKFHELAGSETKSI